MGEANATSPKLEASMLEWIRAVTGAARIHAERRSAGASRAGFAVDAELPDGTIEQLWLRADTGAGPQSHTVYTLAREAAVYRALEGRGVEIASVVAVHPDGGAFLMRRLDGDNWFSQIAEAERQTLIARQFMQQLATLHNVDVHELELPELGPVRTVREHVLDEIEIWEAQYRAQDEPEPLLELALSWLRQHMPASGDGPVVLVQGDTGPGNFMYRGDHLVAVTDWEMAHYGDLHDDLAWIYVRDVQERFTDLRERLRDYERFSGHRVDPARLRYFLVLAQTRCTIGTLNGLLARDSRGEMGNHLIYSALHQRLLAEALAEAMGTSSIPTSDLPAASDTSVTWAYEVALADLRDHVLPALDDRFAERRAKGIARLLKFLREHERLGPAAAQREIDDLRSLLGTGIDDVAAGRIELCRRIASQQVDDLAVVEYCLRVQARWTEILRPAMGALADRHYSPLPDLHA